MNSLWAINKEAYDEMSSIVALADATDKKQFYAFKSEYESLTTEKGSLPPEKWLPIQIEDKTAVIAFHGAVTKKFSFWSWLFGGTSYDWLNAALTIAEKSSKVEKIILSFDSPGGEVNGTSEFADRIKSCNKPITAHVSGRCCSAAYWVASQCEKIYVTQTSIIGSIGVIVQAYDYTEHLKQRGIEKVTLTSQNAKDKAPSVTSKEGQESILKMMNSIEELFLKAVAEGRETDIGNVINNYGQGGVFLGKQALDLGMVDGINTFDDVFVGSSSTTEVKAENETNINAEEGVKIMDEEKLKGDHPELYKAICEANHKAGYEAGVKAENERQISVSSLKEYKGFSAIEDDVRADSSITKEKASLMVLEAGKGEQQTSIQTLIEDGGQVATVVEQIGANNQNPGGEDDDSWESEEACGDMLIAADEGEIK